MKKPSHSIQKYQQSKRLSISKCNYQLTESHFHQLSQHFTPLKRSESSKNLRKSQNQQLFTIQSKYQELQHNFKKVLEQTKSASKLFKKQKDQIQKYKEESLKDKKQIERLRMMLGFIKKQDCAVQVQTTTFEEISLDKFEVQTSTDSKTTIESEKQLRSTLNQLKRKSTKVGCQKILKKTVHEKLLKHKSQKVINFTNLQSEKSIRAKYKFVPTLDLN